MRWIALWCAVLASGCGRFRFDPERSGDGGLGDGAVHDGVTGDGAAGACPAFAVFCDDFESGDLSKWTYTSFVGSNVTAQAVSTRPLGGVFGLEADVPTGGQDHAASPIFVIPPQSTGTLAVREWIYATQSIQNFNLVLVLQNDQTGQFVTVGGDNAARWVSSDNTSANVLTDHSSTVATAPLATWTCLEMVFTFPQNIGPAHIQVFVNETSVLDVNANDPSPVYNGVGVGIPRADNGGFHLFTDDVVIAHQRVGCQ